MYTLFQSAPATLQAALQDALLAARTGGAPRLPRVVELSPERLLRALHVLAVEEEGRWFPCGWLRQGHAPGLLHALAGGWLYLPEAPTPATVDEARRLGVTLWAPGEEHHADLGWRARVEAVERVAFTALDPSLADLRRAMLANARGACAVHLSGEQGVGRASLVAWAHAVLDDRPLAWIEAGEGAPRPGQWSLFRDLDRLGSDSLAALAELQRARAPRPPPPPPRPGRPRPAHPALDSVLGESPAMSSLLAEALELAPTPLSLLLTGEPGVGKEVLARAIHRLSGREGPFVAVDLGAIPEGLAESELFGHRKGAFTGADRSRPGAFRAAEGGTLFLDELGNLPLALQAKLLRALQSREVSPVGEDHPVKVDVRVLSATNADLTAMVARGLFRADLLGRLDEARLTLPPLRERGEDVLRLGRVLHVAARGGPAPEPWITPEAARALLAWRWPGNVRELQSLMRYAAAVCPPGAPVAPEHLGPLSPSARRPTPLFTTGPAETEPSLDALIHGASRLRVPPLRERGPTALRAAILWLLQGRGVTPEALAELERRPWWGGWPELHAAMAAIRAVEPEVVSLETVRRHLPGVPDGASAPIVLLVSPALEPDGRVGGLRRDLAAASALFGRARSLQELRGAAARGDGRAGRWMETISRLSPQHEPACVEIGWQRRLSRAQALLTRDAQGLVVNALPDVAAALFAAPLLPNAPLRRVSPDAPASLGAGGELRLVDTHGELLVQLFVLLGPLALAERGAEALSRAEAVSAAGALTRGEAPPEVGVAAEPQNHEPPVNRVFVCDAGERAALNHLLVSFEGGSLKDHVLAATQTWAALPSLRRLREFFSDAPRLSQYLSRLYAMDENSALREGLREALAARWDGDERLKRLPKGVRDALAK
ncbi:sigma 54-interacting transcriptional regulator [Myxococcota bacterium]|nr:sigma 54-interacting transcriptional regulator [Myxococcota bacterium]